MKTSKIPTYKESSSKSVTKSDKSSKNGDWGRVRDTSLDGKCLSVEEFQSCLWYYIPSFHVQMALCVKIDVA